MHGRIGHMVIELLVTHQLSPRLSQCVIHIIKD